MKTASELWDLLHELAPFVPVANVELQQKVQDALDKGVEDSEVEEILSAAVDELLRAQKKFQFWPDDPLHAIAIAGEEFGELTKAVLQAVYDSSGEYPSTHEIDGIRVEATQCMAMLLRFILSINKYEFQESCNHRD
jgi:hypothetical protein